MHEASGELKVLLNIQRKFLNCVPDIYYLNTKGNIHD